MSVADDAADPDVTRVLEPAEAGVKEQQSRGARPPGDRGRPALSEGIELIGEYEGSGYKQAPFLARRKDGQVIQLTELLYLVAEQADGKKSVSEMAEGISARLGKRVSADNVEYLINEKLSPLGLFRLGDGSEPRVAKPDPMLALKLKKTLIPEGAVRVLAKIFRPLFWPPVMIAVFCAWVGLDIWYFGVHGVAQGLRSAIYNPGLILLVYGLLILSVAWHEIGHATACAYGGGKPGLIGFGIYIVWPAFYTDVTDVYRLGKAARVRTDIGGMYFNGIFALITAGVYFLTGFEPLLIVVLIQHLLVLYQFIPFLRMDGYYVIADLTGVPDLFARIKPTLSMILPWKKTDEEVKNLKPWVRGVVLAWVLLVIPVLAYGFTMMVISAPRVIATGADSLTRLWAKASSAIGGGKGAEAAATSVQMGLLVLPLAGMSVTVTRVGKRAGGAINKLRKEHPAAGISLILMLLAAAAGAAYLLIPNGEYKPIHPEERGTVSDSFKAVSRVSTGRPGLTPERERELEFPPPEQSQPPLPQNSPEAGSSDRPEPIPTPTSTRDGSTPSPTPSDQETDRTGGSV